MFVPLALRVQLCFPPSLSRIADRQQKLSVLGKHWVKGFSDLLSLRSTVWNAFFKHNRNFIASQKSNYIPVSIFNFISDLVKSILCKPNPTSNASPLYTNIFNFFLNIIPFLPERSLLDRLRFPLLRKPLQTLQLVLRLALKVPESPPPQ